ncbi:MAG: zf-TFIIB domain-containing protein, partial [bacterium]
MCPTCRGEAVGIGVLRKALIEETVTRLWEASGSGTGTRGRDCPSCLSPMVAVTASEDSAGLRVEICRKCHFFWFDQGELDTLPANPTPQADRPMPQEAREVMAIAEVQRIAAQYKHDPGSAAPEEKWKYLPAILGMPVEYDNAILTRLPLVTWLVVAAATVVSIPAFFQLKTAVTDFGLIPAEALRRGGLTFIT